ncbi:DUF4191 domain-containing protein [Actinoallomurus vinaceus]|uniref:DUF4191 domain-containing protein n=1 Tax=Actinoallomurus vinaceus TaxID=1080074 RepID=A0ABP8UUD3_9ACTN
MAKKPQDGAQDERPGRLKQIRMVASLVHQANPKAMPIVFAAAIGTLVLFVILGLVLGQALFMIPLGVLVAIAVGMIIFGQVAQRTQYSMIEGQPGAAASLVENMRGRWVVTPAVQANRNMDVVHRVIGQPGVILLSEGPRSRVGKLIGAEKKRISRAASEVPIYDIQVGTEDGQIPISKLQRHLTRLPRNLKKDQVSELIDRLNALPQAMQMPKGPIPRGARTPKGPKPRTR